MTTYSELIGTRVESFANDPNTDVTYTVTVASSDGQNRYFINGVQQQQLRLYEGTTYNFDYSAASTHPFRFSTTADGTHGGGSEYTTGVSVANNITTITIASGAPTLYYYCSSHSGMGGRANTPVGGSLQAQMWYNETTQNFKTITNIEGWSTTAPTNTAKQRSGGCGTQTAGLNCGGFDAPPGTAANNGTEEYDGSGWTTAPNLNTARGNTKLVGIQTAAVFFGQGGGGQPQSGVTEEYNGTAWTTVNPMANAINYRSGCGVETALLATGGNVPSTNRTTENEEYNGTSWSPGTALPQKQSSQGQAGTQTAAINSFGYTNNPVPGNSGDGENAISLEFNGTSWTAGPNGNGVVPLTGYAMGSGTQTDAIFAGAPPTNSCKYDGTTFTVGPALNTAQDSASHGSTSASATWIAKGSPVPSVGSTAQEFNRGINVVTGGAFSSGGTIPQIVRGGSSGGTQTAAWITGGLQYPGDTKNKTWTYDGASWSSAEDLPSNLFVGGGVGPATAGLAWDGIGSYGPGTNTYEWDGSNWTSGGPIPAIGPGGSQGDTGAGVGQTAAVAMGGVGDPPPAQSSRMLAYNGSSWTSDESMPTGVSGCAADGPNTAIWIAGGYSSPDSTSTASKEYNGASWTTTGGLVNALPQSVQFMGWGPQTNAIVAGGNPAADTVSQQYNGTSWATAPSMSTGRDNSGYCSKTSGSQTGFIAGGYSGSANTDATEEFNPGTTSINIKTLTQT